MSDANQVRINELAESLRLRQGDHRLLPATGTERRPTRARFRGRRGKSSQKLLAAEEEAAAERATQAEKEAKEAAAKAARMRPASAPVAAPAAQSSSAAGRQARSPAPAPLLRTGSGCASATGCSSGSSAAVPTPHHKLLLWQNPHARPPPAVVPPPAARPAHADLHTCTCEPVGTSDACTGQPIRPSARLALSLRAHRGRSIWSAFWSASSGGSSRRAGARPGQPLRVRPDKRRVRCQLGIAVRCQRKSRTVAERSAGQSPEWSAPGPTDAPHNKDRTSGRPYSPRRRGQVDLVVHRIDLLTTPRRYATGTRLVRECRTAGMLPPMPDKMPSKAEPGKPLYARKRRSVSGQLRQTGNGRRAQAASDAQRAGGGRGVAAVIAPPEPREPRDVR